MYVTLTRRLSLTMAVIFLLSNCSHLEDRMHRNAERGFDRRFGGSDMHTTVWDCSEEFRTLRGFRYFFTQSPSGPQWVSTHPGDHRMMLAIGDIGTGELHYFDCDKFTSQRLSFLLAKVDAAKLISDNRMISELADLLAMCRSGNGLTVWNHQIEPQMHVFGEDGGPIESDLQDPIIVRLNKVDIALKFYSFDCLYHFWMHEVDFLTDGGGLKISGDKFERIGSWYHADEVDK